MASSTVSCDSCHLPTPERAKNWPARGSGGTAAAGRGGDGGGGTTAETCASAVEGGARVSPWPDDEGGGAGRGPVPSA